jgi:exodeoxyribonuclease V gamma subunit
VLRLTDLQRLLRQPVEVFLRQRLQVEFDRLDELEQEDEPFALNPLQQHQLGAALLQSGADAQALAKLHGAGVLPLAGFGQRAGHDLLDQAQSVWLARNAWLKTYPLGLDAVAVNLLLAPGLTLSGELAGLYASDGAAGSNTPCLQLAARTGGVLEGKAGARSARGHTLPGLWVRHLAGCASGLALTSVQLGVDGAVVFRPLTPDDALQLLKHLAQCHVAAWDAPLPLACKTAWAYLQTERHNPARLAAGKTAKDPHDVARAVFEGGQRGGELAESAYLQRVFQSYAELQPGLPHWAQRLYGDVLAHCELWQEGSP